MQRDPTTVDTSMVIGMRNHSMRGGIRHNFKMKRIRRLPTALRAAHKSLQEKRRALESRQKLEHRGTDEEYCVAHALDDLS